MSQYVFLTRLLTSGILFSTAVNEAVVGKPVLLDILPSISVILVLQSVFFFTIPLGSVIFLPAQLILFSKSDLSGSYLLF